MYIYIYIYIRSYRSYMGHMHYKPNVVNDGGQFQRICKEIYPPELESKKKTKEGSFFDLPFF